METFERVFPFVFPFFFVGMWLMVTTILSRMSGLKALEARFPDRDDDVLAKFDMVSGIMGADVNYNGCLTLGVCRSGLRVNVWRILAPFDRPFLVPWEEIRVEHGTMLFMKRVTLHFGSPPAGKLIIAGGLAERIAKAAEGRWPERASGAGSAPIVS